MLSNVVFTSAGRCRAYLQHGHGAKSTGAKIRANQANDAFPAGTVQLHQRMRKVLFGEGDDCLFHLVLEEDCIAQVT